MKISSQIVVAHPHKHHVYHLISGLVDAGYDALLVAPLYRKGLAKLLSALPGSFGQKLRGYYHENVRRILSPAYWQVRRILSGRDVKKLERDFDNWVALQIREGKIIAKCLVTMQDYMPETVEAASIAGWTVWSDQILNNSYDITARLAFDSTLHGVHYHAKPESTNNLILAKSNLVTAPSNFVVAGLQGRTSQSAALGRIPYGVLLHSFQHNQVRATSENFIRIAARSNSVRKGGHLVLQAIPILAERLVSLHVNVQIELNIIGELEPGLIKLAMRAREQCTATIRAKNFPHAQMPEFYSRQSIFLMPSLAEGMSLAVIEAMASGLPIIASRECGVDCLVDGVMGTIVSANVADIVEALVHQICNRKEWLRIGDACRRAAEDECSWQLYEQRITEFAAEHLADRLSQN